MIINRLHIGGHIIRLCLLICILFYFTGCGEAKDYQVFPEPYRCTAMDHGWVLTEGHRTRVFATESNCLSRINAVYDSN